MRGLVLGGRYELVTPIARGGMAEVWLGHDDTLDRDVAVKLLHAHLSGDPGFVARFKLEAQAAGRLSHPNVVAVYDTGVDGALAYIVMELVRGRSLREVMFGGLAVAAAIDIAAQAAEGLGYAHQQGVVHRDVKPANVLVEDTGRVKVADFGIAKVMHAETTGDDMTQAGTILGTAKYLSPEQVEGGNVDSRSDIYSLGVVLYEMVCGRPPYHAKTELATALAHVQGGAPRPRQVRPGIPRPLDELIVRAMSKNPEQRFASAADMAKALRSIDVAADDAAPLATWTPDKRTPPRGTAKSASSAGTRAGPDDTAWAAGTTAMNRTGVLSPEERGPKRPPPSRSYGPGSRPKLRHPVLAALAALITGAAIGGAAGVFAADSQTSVGTPAALVQAMSFDPFGDGVENVSRLDLLIDKKRSTTWFTKDPLTGENPKDGVGVYVTLAESASLRSLTIDGTSSGWKADVYVADTPSAGLGGWGQAVGQVSNGSRHETVSLHGREGRYVLLWLTDFGATSTQVTLSELSVRRA